MNKRTRLLNIITAIALFMTTSFGLGLMVLGQWLEIPDGSLYNDVFYYLILIGLVVVSPLAVLRLLKSK